MWFWSHTNHAALAYEISLKPSRLLSPCRTPHHVISLGHARRSQFCIRALSHQKNLKRHPLLPKFQWFDKPEPSMPAAFIKNLLEAFLCGFRNSPMHGETARSLTPVGVADLRGTGSVRGGTKSPLLQRPFGPLSLPHGRRGPRLPPWPLFKRTTPRCVSSVARCHTDKGCAAAGATLFHSRCQLEAPVFRIRSRMPGTGVTCNFAPRLAFAAVRNWDL